MSDQQKLKDCVSEYQKAVKNLDDKVNKAEDSHRQSQRELEAQSNRQH